MNRTIAIVGGTGPQGTGLALRWARSGQNVILGSRDVQRAQKNAEAIRARCDGDPNVQGFVKGAYAAAIGTILGACTLLGRIAIGDWLTALIGLLSLAVLFRWKVSNPLLIAATAAVGLIAYPLLQPTWVMVH